jgi:hypothetical protein
MVQNSKYAMEMFYFIAYWKQIYKEIIGSDSTHPIVF